MFFPTLSPHTSKMELLILSPVMRLGTIGPMPCARMVIFQIGSTKTGHTRPVAAEVLMDETLDPILAFPDKKFPVKVKCNPVISTFPSGITYAISESIWIPIPASSTRADLKRWMSWEQPGSQFDEAKVSGSRGNTYVVRRNKATGTLSCSCPGFKWRGKCKHLTKAFPT